MNSVADPAGARLAIGSDRSGGMLEVLGRILSGANGLAATRHRIDGWAGDSKGAVAEAVLLPALCASLVTAEVAARSLVDRLAGAVSPEPIHGRHDQLDEGGVGMRGGFDVG